MQTFENMKPSSANPPKRDGKATIWDGHLTGAIYPCQTIEFIR
jgi:hypothetical protein